MIWRKVHQSLMAVDEVVTDSYTCPYLAGGEEDKLKSTICPEFFARKRNHSTKASLLAETTGMICMGRIKGSRSRKGRLRILSNRSARFPPREDIPETERKQLFGSRGWHPLNLRLSELKSTQVFPPRQQTRGMSRFIHNVFF